MTVMHHPSADTLARFTGGSLRAGLSLVVSAHLSGCAACQAQVEGFEAVAGALLEAMPEAPLAHESVEIALAGIERPPPPPRVGRLARFRADLPGSIVVPPSLRDRDVGPWRWLSPGVRWTRVAVPEDSESLVFLIRVAAGRKLPEHGHSGLELTHVLSGSFHDVDGRYFPGDTLEADPDVDHQPIADADMDCICLAAVEGGVTLRGLMGRVLRSVMSR
jgi:putative transcriptional regulator